MVESIMATRKTSFIVGEYYHIYNRGVDQRIIFHDENDTDRFFRGMSEFNTLNPIGSIYENSFNRQLGSLTPKLTKSKRLVNFVAYCLNPNHYHFILTPLVENGIEKFMQRLGTGHTNYFNNKYHRNGSLFQGTYKSIHIDTNEYLLHLSVYVNLNDRVHQLGSLTPKLVKSRSSWVEYLRLNIKEKEKEFCEKDIILDQFKNKKEYQEFAESSLESILERKADLEDLEKFLLE